MDDDAPRIQAVSAKLLPDCSIEVGLTLPGWDEPEVAITAQSLDFLTRVSAVSRPIDLVGGDRTDELAREHLG